MERPSIIDLDTITEFLNQFGEFASGYPRYRLVWSDDLFENRIGTYSDYTESGLFIRKETEMRRVPKYVVFKSRWVFEKAAANDTPDEIGDSVIYEPVWVFHDKHGNYIEPNLKVIKFLMWFILNPGHVFTPADFSKQEAEEFEKEAEYFLEVMNNEMPDLACALKDGSAVFISGENK